MFHANNFHQFNILNKIHIKGKTMLATCYEKQRPTDKVSVEVL